MGTRLPVHLLQFGVTAEDDVNVATIGIVEAAALRRAE
jgi:phosphotransacetylase